MSFTFTLPGNPGIEITVTEVINPDTGFTELQFDVTSDGGDLRALYFDFADGFFADDLSVSGDAVTGQSFDENNVDDVGRGTNLKGPITKGGNGFDGGVAFGAPGRGQDVVSDTSFTLSSASGDLSLAMLSEMRFGARVDGQKISGSAPEANIAPVGVDDAYSVDEDNALVVSAATGVLANDTDANGDPLTVNLVSGPANGSLTLNADGSFSYTPDANFFGQDTFTYVANDGEFDSDPVTVTITVDPVNDAPVAVDDGGPVEPVYVESGDTVTVAVLNDDYDVDGTLVSSTLQVTGDLGGGVGTAIPQGASHVISFTADDIGGDEIDNSVAGGSTYTVEDNEGAVSNEASLTVQVIDPLTQTGTDSLIAAANGQQISLSLTTEGRTYNTESEVDVRIDFGSLDQPDVNISFVLDGSNSINDWEYDQQIQAVQLAIDSIAAQYAGSGTDVTFQLVQFSGQPNLNEYAINSNLNVLDTWVQTETFTLADWNGTTGALDNVGGTATFSTQLKGFTNYELGLDRAVEFFAGSGADGDDNFLFFISDGAPTRAIDPTDPTEEIQTTSPSYHLDEVTELNAEGVAITAIGFGSVQLPTLNDIDNTGAGADRFSSPIQIIDAIEASAVFPSDVFEFRLSVDGTDVVVLDTEAEIAAGLVDLGGGDLGFSFDALGLDNSLGGGSEITAWVSFDTDGNGVADETLEVTNLIAGTDGSDILFA
jgi:VCBS repeat-containing protein